MIDKGKKDLEKKGQKNGGNPFASILDPEGKAEEGEIRPAFYTDLNINQITDRISGEWGEDISRFYRYLPTDKEWTDYRREVYADIAQSGCYESLCAFLEGMKDREDARAKKAAVRMELQKAVWLLREAACYCDAFCALSESLEKVKLHSEGMLAFTAFLREYLASEGFSGMREAVARLQGQEDSIHLILTYENDRITVAEGEARDSYVRPLEEWFPEWRKKEDIFAPFGNNLNLTELEVEILKVYQKRNPAFVREVERFYSKNRDYAREELIRFSTEICFYLSFYCFERRMEEEGFAFVRPWVGSYEGDQDGLKGRGGFGPGERGNILYAEGVYDLALACVAGKERKIVSNDVAFEKGEKFFVLTGPNQGGKTTYARSLGQLVYLSKMGLDVPAKSAFLPYFADILTHFSVEESVETGRGKLKEELTRLAPMMDSVANGGQGRRDAGKEAFTPAFVVINELFTTAANYDACIMGKRVLEFFLGQGCMGIYVTHLKELADARPAIVSLRAMVDEEGGRTFEIARGEAADSASAADQVRKYGLTYEALKERLS